MHLCTCVYTRTPFKMFSQNSNINCRCANVFDNDRRNQLIQKNHSVADRKKMNRNFFNVPTAPSKSYFDVANTVWACSNTPVCSSRTRITFSGHVLKRIFFFAFCIRIFFDCLCRKNIIFVYFIIEYHIRENEN